jgi:hypothetical protein
MLQVARIAFGTWLCVEILSWVGVFPIHIEFTWLGLVLTAALAWLALEIISWQLHRVGADSLWGWTFLAALLSQCTDAFGDILRLYGTCCWYDQAAHLVGGAVVALVFFNILARLIERDIVKLSRAWQGFIAILGSMAVGSLYEIEEYSEDVIFHSNRLGSAFDTANDMLLNTCGAVLFILAIIIFARKRQHS